MQEQINLKPAKTINPIKEWDAVNPEKLHLYSLGQINTLEVLIDLFKGVDFDLLAQNTSESATFMKRVFNKIQELQKQAELSADQITEAIAKQHRDSDYIHIVDAAPHFGVIWMDAEWYQFNDEFIDLYWMAGWVFNETKKRVILPPVTRTEINRLADELVKVRYKDRTAKSWWEEIETWVKSTDLLYITQENGIWKLYKNSQSRELFNQDFSWIYSEVLSRIDLVARGRIKSQEVWRWLDDEEKLLNCEKIINNKKIRLKYQVLKSGALKWLVYHNGTNHHIKRYELQKVREEVLNGTWQPPN